jgi:hypothetical protein
MEDAEISGAIYARLGDRRRRRLSRRDAWRRRWLTAASPEYLERTGPFWRKGGSTSGFSMHGEMVWSRQGLMPTRASLPPVKRPLKNA